MIKVSKIEREALKRFKEAENAYREWLHKPVHIGNGILEQIEESGELSSSDFFYFFLIFYYVYRNEKDTTFHSPSACKKGTTPPRLQSNKPTTVDCNIAQLKMLQS